MDNILINFTSGDTSGLKNTESGLDAIIAKEGVLGQTWNKTNEQMSAQTKNNADTTNKLAKSIEQLATASKTLDKAVIGGAYKNYLKEIQAQLGLTSKELITYIQNARKAAQEKIFTGANNQEVKELTISIEVMNDQLKSLGVTEDEVSGKTITLRTRLQEAKNELAAVIESGVGGPALDAAKDKVAQLADEFSDLQTEVRTLGSDNKNIDGLISIASGVAGAFAVAQGAMALFGDQGEEVQKALLKVNAAMSILQGLQQIQNLLQKESAANLLLTNLLRKKSTAAIAENAVATEADTVAKTGEAVATGTATVAQEGLNLAMALSPAGILILAVTELVGLYEIFTSGSAHALEAQKQLNRELEFAINLNESYVDAIGKAGEFTIAELKRQGASAAEIRAQETRTIQDQLSQTMSVEESKRAQYQQTADKLRAVVEGRLDLNKEEIETLRKTADEYDKLQKKLIDLQEQLDIKRIENDTEANAESFKSFSAFQEARVAATIAGSDAERKAQIAAIRAIAAEREKTAEFKGLTPGEQALARANDEKQIQALQLQNYQHYLKGRSDLFQSYVANAKLQILKNQTDSIDSIKKVTDAEIEALKKQQKAALSNPTLNKSERAKIVADTNLQIAQLEKDHELTLLNIQKSGINARLLLTKAGTAEEFNARLDLIDKEQEIELSATQLTQDQVVEIKAKHDRQVLEATLANIDTIRNKQIEALHAYDDAFIKLNERILANELRSGADKVKALENIQSEKDAEVDIEIAALEKKKGLIEDYDVQYQILLNKKRSIAEDTEKQITAFEIKEIDKRIDRLKTIIDLMKNGISSVLPQDGFSNALDQINNFGTAALGILEKLKAEVKGFNKIIAKGNAEGATPEQQAAANQASIDKQESQDDAARQAEIAAIGSAQNIINGIYADSAARRQQAVDDEISALEDQKNKELDDKKLTEQQKADIDAKFKEKEKQVKLRGFQADKEAKKEQAIINGLLAITATFAQMGFIPALPFVALQIAETAIIVSQINKAQPPRFKKGEVDIQGPGTSTSDSIPSLISKGESVIKADATAKWKDALQAINNDKFESYLFNKLKEFIFPEVPDSIKPGSNNAIDYDKLASAVASKMMGVIPAPAQVHNTIDGDGLHSFVKRGNSITEYKNQRFSMT